MVHVPREAKLKKSYAKRTPVTGVTSGATHVVRGNEVVTTNTQNTQERCYLSDLDDLHGEDTFSGPRGAIFRVRVDPLGRAGLRHAVEETALCPARSNSQGSQKTSQSISLSQWLHTSAFSPPSANNLRRLFPQQRRTPSQAQVTLPTMTRELKGRRYYRE